MFLFVMAAVQLYSCTALSHKTVRKISYRRTYCTVEVLYVECTGTALANGLHVPYSVLLRVGVTSIFSWLLRKKASLAMCCHQC